MAAAESRGGETWAVQQHRAVGEQGEQAEDTDGRGCQRAKAQGAALSRVARLLRAAAAAAQQVAEDARQRRCAQ